MLMVGKHEFDINHELIREVRFGSQRTLDVVEKQINAWQDYNDLIFRYHLMYTFGDQIAVTIFIEEELLPEDLLMFQMKFC